MLAAKAERGGGAGGSQALVGGSAGVEGRLSTFILHVSSPIALFYKEKRNGSIFRWRLCCVHFCDPVMQKVREIRQGQQKL